MGKNSKSTLVKYSAGLTPVWNEDIDFVYEGYNPDDELIIDVLEKDPFSVDDIGQVKINIKDIILGLEKGKESHRDKLPITYTEKNQVKSAGTIK